jgi:hypothetical protein
MRLSIERCGSSHCRLDQLRPIRPVNSETLGFAIFGGGFIPPAVRLERKLSHIGNRPAVLVVLKKMCDEDLLWPFAWKPAPIKTKPLGARDLNVLVRCVKFSNRQQLTSEFVIRVIQVAYYIIKVAYNTGEKLIFVSFKYL